MGRWDPKTEIPLNKGGSVQRFGMLKLNTNMAASIDAGLTLITFVLIGSHTGAVTGSE
jgi:hypothetical protein